MRWGDETATTDGYGTELLDFKQSGKPWVFSTVRVDKRVGDLPLVEKAVTSQLAAITRPDSRYHAQVKSGFPVNQVDQSRTSAYAITGTPGIET